MGVFDDDGDNLAAMRGAELDVLAGDHDAAAGVDLSLCSQRSRWQQRCGWRSCPAKATELIRAEWAWPGADERVCR
jgi:hypothetical protein